LTHVNAALQFRLQNAVMLFPATHESRAFDEQTLQYFGVALNSYENRNLKNDSHKPRLTVNVCRADVYTFLGLPGEPNESADDLPIGRIAFTGVLHF
jgi:hypothetical protein